MIQRVELSLPFDEEVLLRTKRALGELAIFTEAILNQTGYPDEATLVYTRHEEVTPLPEEGYPMASLKKEDHNSATKYASHVRIPFLETQRRGGPIGCADELKYTLLSPTPGFQGWNIRADKATRIYWTENDLIPHGTLQAHAVIQGIATGMKALYFREYPWPGMYTWNKDQNPV